MRKPIQLFAFSSHWGLSTAGPFCLKLQAWLELVGLDYELVVEDDVRKGPKGKSPWIRYGDETIGDTELIIKRLGADLGLDLDSHLSSGERAEALAWRRLLEEHYHPIVAHTHFVRDEGWAHTVRFYDVIPLPLRPIVRMVIRRAIVKQNHERGIGRHSDEEILAMGIADFEALSERLGNRRFFFGDRPSVLDASAYGFLEFTLKAPFETAISQRIRELGNLERLVRHVDEARAKARPRPALAPQPAVAYG